VDGERDEAGGPVIEAKGLDLTFPTGDGPVRALLDRAKEGRREVDLWTFVANGAARAFYRREGFREIRTTPGDNEEGLPDILLRWTAG